MIKKILIVLIVIIVFPVISIYLFAYLVILQAMSETQRSFSARLPDYIYLSNLSENDQLSTPKICLKVHYINWENPCRSNVDVITEKNIIELNQI